ncbi:unnamed protein product [Caenorhabditis auriculariae]|uniref:Uncharacterized protein n=1 Tax=Caenorhabditis auriculariae TaxID=2777116 RepID=A0A8S1H056_9PELO|nr:unnamed protein product [Caenorhabditis auriculariae]
MRARSSYRCLTTKVKVEDANVIQGASQQVFDSELFDHLRNVVYGDERTIDKIVVTLENGTQGEEKNLEVLANRNLSSHYDCLLHSSSLLADNCALVKVHPDSFSAKTYLRSVNAPVTGVCNITPLTFECTESDLIEDINQAFWRSCRVLASAVVARTFNDVRLRPLTSSTSHFSDGFFTVNADGLSDVLPSRNELSVLNSMARRFLQLNVPFECVNLSPSQAQEYNINGDSLVRVDGFVTAVEGPVIRSTKLIGDFKIFDTKLRDGVTFAGVALPRGQSTSNYAWNLIVQNGMRKFSHL